jgi:hypothetical protein
MGEERRKEEGRPILVLANNDKSRMRKGREE